MLSNEKIYLSVVIPSYKSSEPLENNLPLLVNFLSKKKFIWEIIIVDDGSEDGGKTEAIAKKFNCAFLKNPVNQGKGAALRNGMLHANGLFRIFTDADIPYETDVIDKFVRYLDFKEFDLVVGDRTLHESSYFDDISPLRNFGSRFFSSIVGKFITTGVYDTQCGIKGFRGTVADDLFSVSRINGFTIDVELFYISFKRNYDVKRLPVNLRSQEGNTVNVVKHGLLMLYDIFVIIINFYKGRYKKTNLYSVEKSSGSILSENPIAKEA
jgi:dolichyl-phosphate beta-glucosyltransferase